MRRRTRQIVAIDLFCGAGGLTKGLEDAGIKVRLGVDADPACKYPFSANNKAKFLLAKVEDVKSEQLNEFYGKNSIRVLAGCAPCQTFSTYNQKANSSDERWWLLLQFSRLAKEILPEVITMENVPRLQKQDVFGRFVRDLKRSGYYVTSQVVSCLNYGVPQQRKRLVLLASRLGPIELRRPIDISKSNLTVRKHIGSLPTIKAGAAHKNDRLHRSSNLSEMNQRRIRASAPGGTWRDWDNSIVAKCHRKKQGKTYPSVYGRMKWDEPAPTLTTLFFGFGNGRFGHPSQNRAISLREGAILQSFPRTYKFVEPRKPVFTRTIGRLIGNAVPVKLGTAIGESILQHVSEWRGRRPAPRLQNRKDN